MFKCFLTFQETAKLFSKNGIILNTNQYGLKTLFSLVQMGSIFVSTWHCQVFTICLFTCFVISPSRYAAILHCSFNFYSHNHSRCWVFFHVLIGDLWFYLDKVNIYLKLFLYFRYMSYKIHYFTNIMSCLFMDFIVLKYLLEGKSLNSKLLHFTPSHFMSFLRNCCLIQAYKDFLLWFFLEYMVFRVLHLSSVIHHWVKFACSERYCLLC